MNRETCASGAPPLTLLVNADLRDGASYRYSPAYVVPYFFDDEGEFNLVYNQDATLYVSEIARIDGVRFREPLAMAPLATWFAALGGLPAHTELALRVATYDAEGRAVATSRITWDCTTGTVLSLEQRGNARGDAPPTARVVEFHHAALDHWFMSADAQEIARLDSGATAGWQRTGYAFAAYTGACERDAAGMPVLPAPCGRRFPLLFGVAG